VTKSEVLPILIEKFCTLTQEIESNKYGSVKYFGRISRPIKFTAEILSWYNFILDTEHYQPNSDPARAFKDHTNRIVHYLRDCFIEILSSIDFQSKQQIKTSEKEEFKELKKKLENGEFIYLSHIIDSASKGNLITFQEKTYWKFITHIRNCLVHNAGISNKDYENLIGDITIKKDEWIEGKPTDFYVLIEKTVSLYSKWVTIF